MVILGTGGLKVAGSARWSSSQDPGETDERRGRTSPCRDRTRWVGGVPMKRGEEIKMRGGLKTLIVVTVAVLGSGSLAWADEPVTYYYGVLRRPSDLHPSKKTSLQSYRAPTVVQPKLRKTYAYGWFGAQPYSQVEAQRDFRSIKTRWVWK